MLVAKCWSVGLGSWALVLACYLNERKENRHFLCDSYNVTLPGTENRKPKAESRKRRATAACLLWRVNMNTTNGSVDQKELDDEAIDGGDDAVRSAAASKGTTSRKRPRQSKSASPERKRPHKPKPPPAPPASLVSLMKRDKSVLRFFTSLQENVTYDVDKWKHEAAHWKKMASSASRRKVSGTKTTTPTKKAQRKSNINRKKQSISNSPLLQCANNDEEGSTISITDEALFGELSDDDDHSRDSSASNAKDDNCNKKGEILDVAGEERRTSIILVKLIEAKSLLDLLGVSLVVIETNTSSANEVLMQTNDNEKLCL